MFKIPKIKKKNKNQTLFNISHQRKNLEQLGSAPSSNNATASLAENDIFQAPEKSALLREDLTGEDLLPGDFSGGIHLWDQGDQDSGQIKT